MRILDKLFRLVLAAAIAAFLVWVFAPGVLNAG